MHLHSTSVYLFLPEAKYPYPTDGQMVIDLGEFCNKISMTIINMYGQLVSTKQYDFTDKLQLNIDGTKGVYYLRILTDEGQSAFLKVVKQ